MASVLTMPGAASVRGLAMSVRFPLRAGKIGEGKIQGKRSERTVRLWRAQIDKRLSQLSTGHGQFAPWQIEIEANRNESKLIPKAKRTPRAKCLTCDDSIEGRQYLACLEAFAEATFNLKVLEKLKGTPGQRRGLQAKCIPAALAWNENVCQAKLSNKKKNLGK